jgi:hypothetical protein
MRAMQYRAEKFACKQGEVLKKAKIANIDAR